MTDDIEDWLTPDLPIGALNDSVAERGTDDGQRFESDEPGDDGATGYEGGAEEHEAEVILTADGKHAIPFKVLQEERAQKAELQRQLEQMQAQLAQAQASAGDQGQTGDDSGASDDLSAADWQAVLDDAVDDPELAQIAKAGLAMQAKLDRMEGYFEAQQQKEAQARSQAIGQAMQSDPDMALWSQSGAMLDRVQAVEQALLSVPGSSLHQARDWNGYMASLAAATAAAYPDMPRAERSGTRQRGGNGADHEGLPSSLSVLPSGVEPGTTIRSVEDLGRMPRADAATHLNRLFESGKLFNFLDDMPIGALNTGGER